MIGQIWHLNPMGLFPHPQQVVNGDVESGRVLGVCPHPFRKVFKNVGGKMAGLVIGNRATEVPVPARARNDIILPPAKELNNRVGALVDYRLSLLHKPVAEQRIIF
jgi:hypothetical protein